VHTANNDANVYDRPYMAGWGRPVKVPALRSVLSERQPINLRKTKPRAGNNSLYVIEAIYVSSSFALWGGTVHQACNYVGFTLMRSRVADISPLEYCSTCSTFNMEDLLDAADVRLRLGEFEAPFLSQVLRCMSRFFRAAPPINPANPVWDLAPLNQTRQLVTQQLLQLWLQAVLEHVSGTRAARSSMDPLVTRQLLVLANCLGTNPAVVDRILEPVLSGSVPLVIGIGADGEAIKLFSGSSYGFTDGALVQFEGEGSLGSWVHTFASPEGREEFLRQLQMEIDEWAAVTVRPCLPGAAGMLAQFLRLNSSPGRLGLSGGAIFSHVA